MPLEQLKAKAYDTLAQIEFLQAKLRELNQEILRITKEEQEKKPDTAKK